MSQRNSGYERKPNNFYPTPAWVTELIIPHIKRRLEDPYMLWEPACGEGHMSSVLLRNFAYRVIGTDLDDYDFLKTGLLDDDIKGIVTNPPYGKDSQRFIEHALELTEPVKGFVMMLLRVDYDSAKTRAHLFEKHPAWGTKLVLRKRIKWFDTGKKAGPSTNHAWYIWNWNYDYPHDRDIQYAP